MSLTRMPGRYDRTGGNSSQLYGAGAFTQDGQRQRSQVSQHLPMSSACSVSSAATRPHVGCGQNEHGLVHIMCRVISNLVVWLECERWQDATFKCTIGGHVIASTAAR